MSRSVLLLSLLWSLVEVSSQQTFPYVTFMGQTLANHSYVDLSLVRRPDISPPTPGVQCRTDLGTCCRAIHGVHRGDWYFHTGSLLCIVCIYVLVELAFTYQTIVALSAKLYKEPPQCILDVICLSTFHFLLELCPK